MNKELKSCPFCGGDKIAVDIDDEYADGTCVWRIMCRKCQAKIEKISKNKAIESWNRRADNGKL